MIKVLRPQPLKCSAGSAPRAKKKPGQEAGCNPLRGLRRESDAGFGLVVCDSDVEA